jgi:hypothetical protein
MPEVVRDPDPIAAARLLVAIGAYRALHGIGPSWRQVARAAGWTWQETRGRDRRLRSDDLADRMHTLRRAGLLVFSSSPRSLDVTPAGRRWALRVLSPDRVEHAKELR